MPPSAPLSAPQTSTHISMPWFSGSPANTPKYGLLPATATTRKPAASTPISTSRCQRSTVPRPSSSMAKITPASGALKAAANPPAAPAAISSLAWKPRSRATALPEIAPGQHHGRAHLHRRAFAANGGASQHAKGQRHFPQRLNQRDQAGLPRTGR